MSSKAEARGPALERKGQADAKHGQRPGYLELSKSLAASIIFIMPLLGVYEVGIWRMRSDSPPVVARAAAEDHGLSQPQTVANPMAGDVNAIAGVIKGPLFWLGRRYTAILNVLVVGVLLGALVYLAKRDALRLTIFPVMLAESAAYAVAVAVTVRLTLSLQLAVPGTPTEFAGMWPKIVKAAGAGVYEELLFRLVLLGSLHFIALNVLRMKKWPAAIVAMLVASALFSVAHFVSAGDEAGWLAFRFRMAAGILLSVIFITRGLGIAAWAHAIYNLWIFCLPR